MAAPQRGATRGAAATRGRADPVRDSALCKDDDRRGTDEHEVAAIDQWLPQTQCRQCGYPRCRAYAEAIARGEAAINRCPPGGDTTVRGLAALCRVPPIPLDPACGTWQPRRLAVIDEALCIGCTLCLEACPVDAIVGAAKQMHSVLTAECTGCELCVPPCPVDCIVLVQRPQPAMDGEHRWPDYPADDTDRARRRAESRLRRLRKREQDTALQRRHQQLRGERGSGRIPREIAEAVARVRARRGSPVRDR